MINFDNSATTFPKPYPVRRAVNEALIRFGGNPGRSGHELSILTAEAVYAARKKAADLFGAQTENVVFTSNCTHSLNLAVKGVCSTGGGHIIISNLEHNSVARPVYALSKIGWTFDIADATADDDTVSENFERLIKPNTKAVVCTLGSNVTGRITPYKRICEICRRHNICFIADGAQACGVLDIKLSDGINILCTAGHKSLYGPPGTGLLVTDGSYPIKPLMEGGTGSTSLELSQPDFLPDSLESGTVNTMGIIGLGAGIDFVSQNGIDRIFAHETELCNLFIKGISAFDKVKIYRSCGKYLPIVSFNVDGMTSNELASELSRRGFALRGGLHCSGLAHKAIGTAPEGTVRFSPSVFSTDRQTKLLVNEIGRICE